jgi:hypothetical protein
VIQQGRALSMHEMKLGFYRPFEFYASQVRLLSSPLSQLRAPSPHSLKGAHTPIRLQEGLMCLIERSSNKFGISFGVLHHTQFTTSSYHYTASQSTHSMGAPFA